jgi:hypothetical protein
MLKYTDHELTTTGRDQPRQGAETGRFGHVSGNHHEKELDVKTEKNVLIRSIEYMTG